ncbi:hypothetical protein VSA01S_21140 [Vibrio sagamiensis NBRC 104589]|uniref:Uncharacterized protein n=1 Tax=Vibrio sagamiensis NBRC 104589 TaxID=1219064 RepID=A0A511QHS3_9VIBR|nr:hypothetical protein VSA01S_21140 [Vibrio sagamiensis NBRC 104589]
MWNQLKKLMYLESGLSAVEYAIIGCFIGSAILYITDSSEIVNVTNEALINMSRTNSSSLNG